MIDEVGYVEIEPAQVGLFFTLMQKRHKTKTTLITSNLGFSEWGSFLKNNQLDRRLARSADGNQPCDQHEELPQLAAQAGRGRRKRRGMNFDDLRRRAAVVRAVPLETVLLFRGAVRDRHDRRKWHTEQGPLSVTGPKFIELAAGAKAAAGRSTW